MPIRHLASQLKYSVPLVIIGYGLALLVVGFSSVENVVFDERTFLRLILIFLFLGATIEGLRRYLNLGYYFSCAALTFILCLAAAKIGALLVVLVFSKLPTIVFKLPTTNFFGPAVHFWPMACTLEGNASKLSAALGTNNRTIW